MIELKKEDIKEIREGGDWDLIFEGEIYKTVKAKYLYDLMSENAFMHNEPGILNLDHINRYNNGFYMFYIQEVNPCFTGDTIVAVADGRNGVSIKDLADSGKTFPVYSARSKKNKGKWKAEIKNAIAFKTGTRGLIEVILSDGSTFRCTPDHRLATSEGNYIEAKDSLGIELEKFFSFSNKNTKKSYRHINSKSNGYAKQYRMMWEYKNGDYDGTLFNIDHKDSDSTNDLYNNLDLISIADHKNKTDNTGDNNAINKIDKERLSILQRYKGVKANAVRYHWSEERFLEAISKLPEIPKKLDINVDMSEAVTVVKIRDLNYEEDVYDLIVVDNHNFYILTKSDDDRYLNSSGVLVHNCGEIVMGPYSLCCLSSINLTKFVKNPFTENAYFEYSEYRKTIKTGVRFLDNVLDATKYPLKKIETNSKGMRRVGLGFTGLGDMFAMLGIVYGSIESKQMSEQIGVNLRNTSYQTSIDLAREKGKFKKCNNKKIIDSGFIRTLPKHMQKQIRKYGLRNIGINTIAPTGTTSFSVGENCSSGIEPIFSLQYDRKIRTGRDDETKTETVYDYAWLRFLENSKNENYTIENAPKVFTTTFDINVYDAIDIQAIFQKYIDHSISKTLNLPIGTTIEEYSKLFKYAYDKGLKGFTTFNPEGSMKGILSTGKKEEITEDREAPKRPKDLDCDIHEIKSKGESYLILVGIYDGKPYEFFTGKATKKDFDIKKYKKGILRKVKKNQYALIIKNGEDKVYIDNIGEAFDTSYGTLSRFISMSLRHGTDVAFVVDQLNKDSGFADYERIVGRVLKKYIGENEKVKTSEKCPECGSNLIYIEGCKSCENICGWSKCS